MYVCACMCVHVYTCLPLCVCACVCLRACACMRVRVPARVFASACASTCLWLLFLYVTKISTNVVHQSRALIFYFRFTGPPIEGGKGP